MKINKRDSKKSNEMSFLFNYTRSLQKMIVMEKFVQSETNNWFQKSKKCFDKNQKGSILKNMITIICLIF